MNSTVEGDDAEELRDQLARERKRRVAAEAKLRHYQQLTSLAIDVLSILPGGTV